MHKIIHQVLNRICLYTEISGLFLCIKLRLTTNDFIAIAQKAYQKALTIAILKKSFHVSLCWQNYYANLYEYLLKEYKTRKFVSNATFYFLIILRFLRFVGFDLIKYLITIKGNTYGVFIDEKSKEVFKNNEYSFVTYTCDNPNLLPLPIAKQCQFIDLSFDSKERKIALETMRTTFKDKLMVLWQKIMYPYLCCHLIEYNYMNYLLALKVIKKCAIKRAYFEECLNNQQLTCFAACKSSGLDIILTYRTTMPYLPFHYFGYSLFVYDKLSKKILMKSNKTVHAINDNPSFSWRDFEKSKISDSSNKPIIGYGPDLGNFLLNWNSKIEFDKKVLIEMDRNNYKTIIKCHPQALGETYQTEYYDKLPMKYETIKEINYEPSALKVFKEIDVWITFMSTTVMEALLCKIPVLIINFDGDDIYSELINISEGLISYINSPSEINTVIKKMMALSVNKEEYDRRWKQSITNIGINPEHADYSTLINRLK